MTSDPPINLAAEAQRRRQAAASIAAFTGGHGAAHATEITLELEHTPRVTVRVEANWREVQRVAPDAVALADAKVTEAGSAGDMASYHRFSGASDVWRALADFAEAEALAPSDV
jgi:hypothetical protein